MSLRDDLRHGGRIGRAEFVRSVRGYSRDTRRLVGLGFAVLFFGGTLLSMLPLVYLFGRRVGSVASIPHFEPTATLLPAALLVLAALRTMERLGGIEAEDLLLTAVHPRAVVVGLIVAEVSRLLLWFGLPLVLVVVTFAVGLGAPTLPVTAGVVALPLVTCAAVWGYAVGIGSLRVLRRLPTVRRVLKAAGVLALVALVVLSQVAARYLVEGDVSLGGLLSALSFAPAVDYLTLAFVGTPVSTPVTPAAVVALVACLGLTPVGLALAERQATALWFTDAPARQGRSRPADPDGSAGGFSPPRPFAWSKAGRIAWGHLTRAARHPQELSHLLMLVFFAGPLGGTFFGDSPGDSFPLLVAGAGVLVGVYLAGAAFGLNPLGDDRPQIPLVLLTETAPGTFLRGRVLAGLAVGLPLSTLVPLASVAAGTRPLHGVAFAVLGATFSLLAALFALGLGCVYPVYEARELWGTETVAPSTLVMMGYSLVVLVGTVVGLALAWFGLAGDLAPTGLLLGGLGAYLLPTVGVPLLAYRYSRGRYRRYVLD